MIDIAILGASGFVGAELLRLSALHPVLRPVRLFGDSQAGQQLAQVHPHLGLAYPDLTVETFSPSALDGVGMVFAALPHGKSQEVAPAIIERGIPFVDLGADFRLDDAATYERWYKEPHRAPELMGRFVYGIPEVNRARIAASKTVAAAGCYPTSAILALRPLLDLIQPGTIVVDAASGVSGAGKALKEETHFNTVDENLTAYGLLGHRHTAEMEMLLGAGLLFTPHLAPVNRGILATCHGVAARPLEPDEPLRALEAAYAGEPFIQVSERPPSTKWTCGSNAVHLTARYDERTGRVLAIAALDNLVKGAAGQMIQCANLMLGLDEAAGLPKAGMWP
ncbi:N-acetyl-gamma-glutamyl-phosphate reductase [Sphingosinicella sp. CPCC 101087]|uniref:N-acetyl-gamma-glutamyl-phosphate reductase n=1 Tax=Sphingosinicella sp. CPCC 101087 TaxID=2497754 RepID=UPI00101BAF96|nr:N-acetyl-gamma-glutamyl-phosphate reductase [Sphingosinicella sp. CPCC 101087]